MNEQELKEIEARAAAIPPGPYELEPEVNIPGSYLPGGDPPYGEPAGVHVQGSTTWIAQYCSSNAVGSFISHACEDVPLLCEEVRRLNEIISDAGDMAAEIRRAQRAEDFAKSDNARLRAALEKIASVVYGGYIFDGDTYAHTSTVETLRQAAKEALKGGEG